MTQYAVIVRVRDPRRQDAEHNVVVEVPPETPRDLHAEVAQRIAAGKIRETIPHMPHLYRITVHGCTPHDPEQANAGNAVHAAGRQPIDAGQPRGRHGRFVKS